MSTPDPRIPSSTYRLQFNREFTFQQAREIVPYLHALGISDCYASPYFQARAESLHGYDITDHNKLNAAIGSREEYDAWIAELRAREMGQILDFVPNHMGVGEPHNLWWADVLENGPSSPFAAYFDIEWQPLKTELRDKVSDPDPGRSIRTRSGTRRTASSIRERPIFPALLRTRISDRARDLPSRPRNRARAIERS